MSMISSFLASDKIHAEVWWRVLHDPCQGGDAFERTYRDKRDAILMLDYARNTGHIREDLGDHAGLRGVTVHTVDGEEKGLVNNHFLRLDHLSRQERQEAVEVVTRACYV